MGEESDSPGRPDSMPDNISDTPDGQEKSRPKEHKGAGHRGRLRKKFLESLSLEGFHEYEIIELLLTMAQPRRDCKDQAKAALKQFKTFQGVLEALLLEAALVALSLLIQTASGRELRWERDFYFG